MDLNTVYHHLFATFPNVLKTCRHQISLKVRDITVSIAIPVHDNIYEVVLLKNDRIFNNKSLGYQPSKRYENPSDVIAEIHNIIINYRICIQDGGYISHVSQ